MNGMLPGPGARAELAMSGEASVAARLVRMDVGTLTLSTNEAGSKAALALIPGQRVTLRFFATGARWRCEAKFRERQQGKSTQLIFGSPENWQEEQRRNRQRSTERCEVRLIFPDGTQLLGWTRDYSSDGMSLLVAESSQLAPGRELWVSLRPMSGEWSELEQVEIVRLESWISTKRAQQLVGVRRRRTNVHA